MKCRFCNSEIGQGAHFCPNCGKDLSIQQKCANCGEILENDSQFCPHCGAKQSYEQNNKTTNQTKWLLLFLSLILAICAMAWFITRNSSQTKMAEDSQSIENTKSVPIIKDSVTSHHSLNKKENSEKSSTPSQAATKNLGYAIYKGGVLKGKPHGVNGRMVFKTSHLLDSRDPKRRYASPGDYIIGEYYNGHLVQGIWYDSDNQVKGSVIIGR